MSRPHTHTGTHRVVAPATSITDQPITTTTGQSSSELVRAVRELVSVAVSRLQSHSHSSCEDILSQLPCNDNDYHSYELVRQLEGLISEHLSPLVARQLDELVVEGDGHSLAAKLTEDIISSHKYKQLYHNLTSDLRDTVDEMLTDSAHLSLSPAHTTHTSTIQTPSSSQYTQYYSLDASLNSDLSNLLSHTTSWSPDQLLAISQDLAPGQPLQVRIEAMNHLLRFPVGDLVAMDTWSQLRPILSDILMDPDPTLASMSLSLHHLLLTTYTSSSCHEAYLSLVQQLSGFFQSHEGVAVTMVMGIDCGDDRSLKLIQQINLLNRFQRDVTKYWIRFNQKVVKDIIESTFDLLLLGYNTPTQLRPIHYISLLDPHGQWFIQWTHGEYSRSIVLSALRQRPQILQTILTCLMSCMMYHSGSSSDHSSAGYYNEHDIKYMEWCHNISLFERLVRWEGGRDMFPVPLNGEVVSIATILVYLIQLLYSLSPPPVTVTSLNPAHLIIHLFQVISSANAETVKLLMKKEVLDILLSPIKSLITNNQGVEPGVAMETIERVGQIVGKLLSTESGRGLLLSSTYYHQLAVIEQFTNQCLILDTSLVTPVVMTTWLFVCRQLYKSGVGLVAMEKFQIPKLLANRILKIGVQEVKVQLNGCGFQLGRELVDNLLSVCSSPLGVRSLRSFPRLLTMCVEYMWSRMKQGLQVSWCDRYGYGCLVSQLSSTFSGAKELIRCGLVASLVNEVLECIEGNEDMLITPWTHPLDITDHAHNKMIIKLLNTISNYPVMCELLNSDLSTTPTLILRLFGNLITSGLSPQKSLLGYPENHIVGARVISMVTTSLDTLLLLQQKFNLTDLLLRQQRMVTMETDTVILDECSIIINRILVSCYLIGGPSERRLPPLSITHPHEEYPWKLFTNYPPPPCYHGDISWSTKVDKDSILYKLLSQDHTHSNDVIKGVWLSELRDVYYEEVIKRQTLSNDMVARLLVGVAKTRPLAHLMTGDATNTLYNDDTGILMIIRYGERLGLLSTSHNTHLTTLKSLLTHHKPHPQSSTLQFDWLVGIAYIIAGGDSGKASTITQLIQTQWRITDTLCCSICHCVEMILESEAPQLLAAFQLCGCVPAQVICHWLRQYFINYLNWPQILLYLATSVVMGTDYLVYWYVSYLRSMEAAILLHSQRGDLLPHLLEYPTEFRAHQWLEYMKLLQNRYRDTVMTSLILDHE